MTDGVRVLVLGPVAVRTADTVTVPSSAQTRALVGALALAGPRGLCRGELTEAVWPEDGTGAGRHRTAIPVAVHRARAWLRATAGDAAGIGSTPTGYALTGEVDAARFAALVAGGRSLGDRERARVLAEALELWRADDPMDGVPLAPVQEAAAAALRRTRLAAILDLGGTLLRLGRAADAVGALAATAARYPLDEQAQGLLIEALAASGRQAEALERYERLRLRLAEDLGVDPGQELSETLVRVLRQDLPRAAGEEPAAPEPAWAPPAVPAQLPPDTAGFRGRAGALAELDRLRAAGASGSVLICAVDGIGGVGKTALGVRWAHQVAAGYPDGQLHVDLRGSAHAEPVPPVQALARLLRTLGVPAERVPADLDEAAALYRSLLAGRRTLVMLDNARSAEQVRPLLPGSPACLVLVTSRDRLDGLVVLDGARRMTLDVLDPGEAVALLAAVLGGARIAAEPDAAAELAALCGHLPLALRITAAQLAAAPDRSLAAQAAALRADRWGGLSTLGDPRSSVRAAFDLSYQHLEEPDRRLFRLLGLAPGADIGLPAAAGLAGWPVPATRRALARLGAAHLVREERGRYSLHDLVGEYARDRAEPGDADPVTGLCRWYLAATDSACQLLYPGAVRLPVPAGTAMPAVEPFRDPDTAAAWLEEERTNLIAVASHAAAHGPREVAWLLADSLGRFLRIKGYHAQGTVVGETALAAATAAGDLRGISTAQRVLARASRDQGAVTASLEHYRGAMVAARDAGWLIGQAAGLNGLATAYAMTGAVATAADLFREAIELGRGHGLTGTEWSATANLATALRGLGRLEEALECHSRLAGWRGNGDEVLVLGNLAEIQLGLGRLADAEATAREAHERAVRTGHRTAAGNALQILTRIQSVLGRPAEAVRTAEAALELAHESGHRWLEEGVECAAGEAHRLLGAHAEARRHLDSALRLSRSSANLHIEADTLVQLALVMDARGEREAALGQALRALALAHHRGYRLLEADALAALATIHLHRGEPEPAGTHAARALRRYEECGAAVRAARVRDVLAAIAVEGAAAPIG